jgi:hypothetical protein
MDKIYIPADSVSDILLRMGNAYVFLGEVEPAKAVCDVLIELNKIVKKEGVLGKKKNPRQAEKA